MDETIIFEENENKLVNISIYKRYVKSLRFKDIASRSQVLYKKLLWYSSQNLQDNPYVGVSRTGICLWVLQSIFEDFFENHPWVTASAKYPLFITST